MNVPNEKASLLIGICDDEKHIHETVRELVEAYAEKQGMACQLISFYSGEELLEADMDLDFLFLDIEMPELDGIDTAFQLRDRGKEYKIIMLTVREDRYREAFRIGAFRFVPKPVREDEIFRAMDEVREHLAGMTQVEVYRDGISYRIMQRDILYAEANRDFVLIFTKAMEYRSEQSLAAWLQLLDGRMFFQCHRSYIVNMAKISEIGKNVVELVTGERIPVSRRLYAALLQAYMIYDTKRR